MAAIEIRSASSADLTPARALLVANALPLDGFPDHPECVWVAADREHVVGVVALELYRMAPCCAHWQCCRAFEVSISAVSLLLRHWTMSGGVTLTSSTC